jgi:hypothetical protein
MRRVSVFGPDTQRQVSVFGSDSICLTFAHHTLPFITFRPLIIIENLTGITVNGYIIQLLVFKPFDKSVMINKTISSQLHKNTLFSLVFTVPIYCRKMLRY